VSRPHEVEKARRDLPIIMMEQEIMEAIYENSVVILCGETGCGKTTQVPQVSMCARMMLLECVFKLRLLVLSAYVSCPTAKSVIVTYAFCVVQFLYEAGFGTSDRADRKGMIGITQPRRVAVLATARRVSYELGLKLGREVGFQVRHDRKVGSECSIKFMTDGILLREIQVVYLSTYLICFYQSIYLFIYFFIYYNIHIFFTQVFVHPGHLCLKESL
jgi:ATP-dependent RNA helicase DHX37/DHR1